MRFVLFVPAVVVALTLQSFIVSSVRADGPLGSALTAGPVQDATGPAVTVVDKATQTAAKAAEPVTQSAAQTSEVAAPVTEAAVAALEKTDVVTQAASQAASQVTGPVTQNEAKPLDAAPKAAVETRQVTAPVTQTVNRATQTSVLAATPEADTLGEAATDGFGFETVTETDLGPYPSLVLDTASIAIEPVTTVIEDATSAAASALDLVTASVASIAEFPTTLGSLREALDLTGGSSNLSTGPIPQDSVHQLASQTPPATGPPAGVAILASLQFRWPPLAIPESDSARIDKALSAHARPLWLQQNAGPLDELPTGSDYDEPLLAWGHASTLSSRPNLPDWPPLDLALVSLFIAALGILAARPLLQATPRFCRFPPLVTPG